MKAFFKILGLVLAVLVLAGFGYGGALYLGWVPVPRFVTDQIARARHLDPKQTETLHKGAEVYSVLKTAPEASLTERALKMLRDRVRNPDRWMRFAAEAAPQVTPATLEKVRTALDMDPAQFQQLQNLGHRVLDTYQKTGKITVTPADTAFLKGLDDEYGISTLVGSLR